MANYDSFMDKTIQKAVMTRSRLRSKFLKTKLSLTNLPKKLKKLLCQFFWKVKKGSFENLETKTITDSKVF